MINKIAGALLFLFLLTSVSFAFDYPTGTSEINSLNEVRTVLSAEITYFATTGNYGSLSALRQAGLIDASLANGNKYGYDLVVSVTPSTPASAGSFTATATPRVYRKNGRWSFYVDKTGILRGADKGGVPATVSDPIIDDCAHGSIAENEACTIRSMRTVHSAEVTYYSTSGSSYTGLAGLASAGLINASLASGQLRGYSISVTAFPQTPSYSATAVPQMYGITGIRSFFVDESGVVRAADHQGGLANVNDPAIVDSNGGSIADNEQSAISSMRTVHSAEVTWFANFGYNYTDLAGLAQAGLIDAILASGQRSGYSFSVVVIPQTPTEPAGYRANAIPQMYGRTGRRSFFIDESGVIRAADHHGGPASANDPPI
jgi:hypothetical protein